MIVPAKNRSNLFVAFAVLFSVAAIFHFVGIFYKVNDAPFWRHVLFVAIDVFCVYGLLRRPKYFVYLFGLFLLQQYYSHGSYLINMWTEKKQLHWISIFILLLLPIILMNLIAEHKSENTKGTN